MNFQLDNDTGKIIVHVPINFRRWGGKKVLIGPQGEDLRLLEKEIRKDEKLLKALARAYKWQKLIATMMPNTVVSLVGKVGAALVAFISKVHP